MARGNQLGLPNGADALPSATTLFAPVGLAAANDGLYVADTGNNRVLFFPTGTTEATRVYGQPDFVSVLANGSASVPSAASLAEPRDVAVASDGVYIADTGNHRVLFYEGLSDASADRVYGQPTFTTNMPNNNGNNAFGTPEATNLQFPYSVETDGNDLAIADTGNNRALLFVEKNTTAVAVYGQPSFTSNTPNTGGTNGRPTAASLNGVSGISYNGAKQVYVADTNNNRVLLANRDEATPTQPASAVVR